MKDNLLVEDSINFLANTKEYRETEMLHENDFVYSNKKLVLNDAATPPLKIKKNRGSNSMAEHNLKGMISTKEYLNKHGALPKLVSKQGRVLERAIKHAQNV